MAIIWKPLNMISLQPFDQNWYNLALSTWSATENLKFWKFWQMAVILKIEKLQYLQNFLVDFDEVLHGGTYWPTCP